MGYCSCVGWGVTAIQLDLPSLTPLSVLGCGRLQLGALHFATPVALLLEVDNIIDPTFCGSRFSTGRLLVIEDITFTCFTQITLV